MKSVPDAAPEGSTPYELIEAVNAVRAEHGLAGYTPNSVLMSIAQFHAEYLASIGVSNTHIDSFGRRPFQRALDAGYQVAGDLSSGGFFSENVVGGVGLTAEGAVELWMGDAPHQNTILSTFLQDVGTGVAVIGNTFFYVLDAGLSTGGTPVVYTPPPYVIRTSITLPTNTPNPDGGIIHIVQVDQTLLEISIIYNVPLVVIYSQNNLSEKSVIYPDQSIIIRYAFTATPTRPTATATNRPSSTLWPTSSKTHTLLSPSPTSTPTSVLPSKSTAVAVIVIIIAAFLAAGILSLVGPREKRG